MDKLLLIEWREAEKDCSALWRSESGYPPPTRVMTADDRITADKAYRLACEGTALLWRGDFHNAQQLLQALNRRIRRKSFKPATPPSFPEAFHLYRQAQSQRARILSRVLLPFEADHHIPLRRAPNVQMACTEAYGTNDAPYVASLRELLGVVGAHEWRKKGVYIPTLKGRIYPYYGVFSPVRGEYIELVAQASLPSTERAFDIGTGTGVLAAVLARRGVKQIVATDQDARALACARANIDQLGLSKHISVVEANLFPDGRAGLIICNPPWVPAKPSSSLEYAVYDPGSQMLKGFLNGLASHLEPGGEGWLILSDLAEHLGLRTRAELLSQIAAAGLAIIDKVDISPSHPRALDKSDLLYTARSVELTSLWRLAPKIQNVNV
jgi:methylase of polypeptide subunit release factors